MDFVLSKPVGNNGSWLVTLSHAVTLTLTSNLGHTANLRRTRSLLLNDDCNMDDESAEIELVCYYKRSVQMLAYKLMNQLEQNLNKTHQISQRMVCESSSSLAKINLTDVQQPSSPTSIRA
jgi:hypothetical protein